MNDDTVAVCNTTLITHSGMKCTHSNVTQSELQERMCNLLNTLVLIDGYIEHTTC